MNLIPCRCAQEASACLHELYGTHRGDPGQLSSATVARLALTQQNSHAGMG